jgi:hypothetical protein
MVFRLQQKEQLKNILLIPYYNQYDNFLINNSIILILSLDQTNKKENRHLFNFIDFQKSHYYSINLSNYLNFPSSLIIELRQFMIVTIFLTII